MYKKWRSWLNVDATLLPKMRKETCVCVMSLDVFFCRICHASCSDRLVAFIAIWFLCWTLTWYSCQMEQYEYLCGWWSCPQCSLQIGKHTYEFRAYWKLRMSCPPVLFWPVFNTWFGLIMIVFRCMDFRIFPSCSSLAVPLTLLCICFCCFSSFLIEWLISFA